ncbi:hypothetical protein DNK06_23025 [Pseudomonas daroniae]|uniref:Uncharacterized protein n=1 Tax=Phytopseudomonas daroniae TaxID=2487519 RepID=A0A4Q9QFF5_9GAMM|nr:MULTISPECIES: hypothetical protein [Pseudomonas]TBU72002.1 hypothetical protein DNK06_23025 [Pseudomonas daroniae]TBU75862.1 hypothetical protein DNK31_22845 [Pseudomonas sp. FRB 228]TBU77361.1 hypothetical protein DNK10_07625 [Pseudomonas daroniae]TBU87138.1 hypothetical protein DNJ99_22725 [Pseudomonas daroniae]
MTPDDYNRLRKHVDFLESLLAVLVIALFVLAMFRPDGELLIALAVVIAGVLLSLYRQHRTSSRYACPGCGESPHSKTDGVAGERHDPATPNCLHCGQRLSE